MSDGRLVENGAGAGALKGEVRSAVLERAGQAEPPQAGRLRRALLGLGTFALIVVGLHAGADRFDDLAFAILSFIDRLADAAATAVIEPVGSLFGATEGSIERATYRAVEWVDLDGKLLAARYLALSLELAADLLLALPVLDPRLPRVTRSELARAAAGALKDPTVLRWAGPLAIGAAVLAGTALVSRELQVGVHELATHLELDPFVAAFLARLIGLSALLFSAIVLGLRAMERAVLRADRRATEDLRSGRPGLRRRLRGLPVLALALPLSIVALFEAGTVLNSLRGLLG